MSLNEINKAKKFGDKYCVCLVRGIDVSSNVYKEIIPLQNLSKLLDEEKLILVSIKWRVTISDQYNLYDHGN